MLEAFLALLAGILKCALFGFIVIGVLIIAFAAFVGWCIYKAYKCITE